MAGGVAFDRAALDYEGVHAVGPDAEARALKREVDELGAVGAVAHHHARVARIKVAPVVAHGEVLDPDLRDADDVARAPTARVDDGALLAPHGDAREDFERSLEFVDALLDHDLVAVLGLDDGVVKLGEVGDLEGARRDGYYLENVDAAKSDFNYFTGAQYGIHYMYTRDCTATGNRAVGVRGGYALMSSDRVTLTKSYSSRNIEFGILLNVADGCLVEENTVEGVHNPKGRAALDNEGKGIFIYGPGKSRVTRNWIAESDIGIGVALGGEGNVLWDNAFVDNQIQVRYVGETPLEWSFEGRGNYWSTNLGWDVDHDGISDRAYQPNDSLDRIFWIYPEARFLMDSPVTALLRWLASQFEIDRGKGVTDSHPLVRPPVGPDVHEIKTDNAKNKEPAK